MRNEDESKDYTPYITYNNSEGESALGLRYTKHKDKEVTSSNVDTEVNLDEMVIKRETALWKQTKLMIWKNFLVFSRNIRPTMFLLLTPIIICLILLGLQSIVNNYSEEYIQKRPEIIALDRVEKCVYPKDCTTIGYGIISSQNKTFEQIENIMRSVALENDLEFDKDVKKLTVGNSQAFLEYLKTNQNKTKYGVVFCLENMDYMNISIPCSFEHLNYTFHMYTILYNITLLPNSFLTSQNLPFPVDPTLTKLKQDMDNAYLKYYAEKRGLNFIPKINATIQTFPVTENRFIQRADVISSTGAFYFFFPPMITFVLILLEIIREKDMKLRKSLLIIGLNNGSFWLSWLITSIVFSFVVSVILVVFSMICQFDVFINTPFLISVFLFFNFTLTMQFLGYFLTTILKSIKSAYTVSYAFILVGLVMEIFLSNYAIIYYLYSLDLPWWVDIIKILFELYPPFNFSKAFSDIANKSANHFDNFEWRWVAGPGYTWGDLFKRIQGTMRPNIEYDVPSTAETMGFFFLDMILFAVLAWYFDHVDSSNRGKTYDYLFFLDKNYWFGDDHLSLPVKDKRKELEIDQLNSTINRAEQKLLERNSCASDVRNKSRSISLAHINCNSYIDNEESYVEEYHDIGLKSVLQEKLKILKHEQDGRPFEGLRILGCSKKYRIANKCCGSRLVYALKDTYLEIPAGELFTILGHNGAGKSTLINILTGNISPSSGSAKINNSDILQDQLAVEELIGLCPQHDILWDELTAKEHIELYAHLRNFPEKYIPKLIESKLKEVNLLVQANSETRTFSGGMKRRLSILLSTVGQPKVIFLDEPTTGLDPVNKRFIWSMIQKMKRNKAVVLTTHSMEEADFLSDRIGVIVEGRYKCIGTPIDLKKIFGGGYLLTFVCERDKIERVQEIIRKIMPSSVFLDNSGGSIILNLPFDKVNEMKSFIAILNNRFTDPAIRPLEGLIRECGMNYTTLEEIFLKITGKKHSDKINNYD